MNKPDRTRIMIVDNRTYTRKTLITHLTNFDDLLPVAEAASGIEALHLCSWVRPDVVLMSLRTTESDDFLAAHLMRQLYGNIQIIVLTSSSEIDEFMQSELKSAVIGFLKKDTSALELAHSIRNGCGAIN